HGKLAFLHRRARMRGSNRMEQGQNKKCEQRHAEERGAAKCGGFQACQIGSFPKPQSTNSKSHTTVIKCYPGDYASSRLTCCAASRKQGIICRKYGARSEDLVP